MYYEKFLAQKLDFGQSIKVLLDEIKRYTVLHVTLLIQQTKTYTTLGELWEWFTRVISSRSASDWSNEWWQLMAIKQGILVKKTITITKIKFNSWKTKPLSWLAIFLLPLLLFPSFSLPPSLPLFLFLSPSSNYFSSSNTRPISCISFITKCPPLRPNINDSIKCTWEQ